MFDTKIKLPENSPQNEIVHYINNISNEYWMHEGSYDKKNISLMRSSPLTEINNKNKEMSMALFYIYQLVKTNDASDFNNFDNNIDGLVRNELMYWESKGVYSIYINILAYAIFTRCNILKQSDISYYQGYYDFKLRKDFPTSFIFSERQLGIHAWLTVKDSVFDLTANQNKVLFDFQFKDSDMIVGEYPEGYHLYGFKESEKTIYSYISLFSEKANLCVDEWVGLHIKAMRKLFSLDES